MDSYLNVACLKCCCNHYKRVGKVCDCLHPLENHSIPFETDPFTLKSVRTQREELGITLIPYKHLPKEDTQPIKTKPIEPTKTNPAHSNHSNLCKNCNEKEKFKNYDFCGKVCAAEFKKNKKRKEESSKNESNKQGNEDQQAMPPERGLEIASKLSPATQVGPNKTVETKTPQLNQSLGDK